MPDSYMNQVLRVDLSTGSVIKESLAPTLKEKYIGGRGFGVKVLYDEVKPGVDPLGPDNLLVFATGPLTGTLAPTSGRIDVVFKSPLTGILGIGNGGGFWGPELKYAGYDMLVVKGKAAHPVFLWIDDDSVEIRDAAHLWGKDSWEATDLIKQGFPDSHPDRVRVLAIGQAGENLVKIASTTIDYHHSASKCGIGAVMGSKNLKAIAVRGSKGVAVAQPDKLEQAARAFKYHSVFQSLERYGLDLYKDDLPAHNYQKTTLPHWGTNFNGKQLRRYLKTQRHACYCCSRAEACAEVKDGKYAGVVAGDLHRTLYMGWGAICAIDSLPAVYKLTEVSERLGLDYHTAANLVAFVMELYQRGIITREDTGGLEMEWGNYEAAIALLHKIANREGFGDVLADGSAVAMQRIGNGAEKYNVDLRGLSPGAHDPRLQAWFGSVYALGHLTSPRSGDNVNTTHLAAWYQNAHFVPIAAVEKGQAINEEELVRSFVERIDMPAKLKRQVYGTPPRMNSHSYEGKAPLMVFMENMTTVDNMLGTCILVDVGPTISARLLSVCTGVDTTIDRLLKLGERVFALMWAYNAREGVTPKSTDFPERFYRDPVPDGPAKGSVLSREEVWQAMAEYLRYRGWDEETGLPTQEKLKELDLKEVAEELKGLKLIKTGSEVDT